MQIGYSSKYCFINECCWYRIAWIQMAGSQFIQGIHYHVCDINVGNRINLSCFSNITYWNWLKTSSRADHLVSLGQINFIVHIKALTSVSFIVQKSRIFFFFFFTFLIFVKKMVKTKLKIPTPRKFLDNTRYNADMTQ